jgi:hypothetical protein
LDCRSKNETVEITPRMNHSLIPLVSVNELSKLLEGNEQLLGILVLIFSVSMLLAAIFDWERWLNQKWLEKFGHKKTRRLTGWIAAVLILASIAFIVFGGSIITI